MRHAGRILAAARKGDIMPLLPLPPRVKSAVSRQNQHLTSRHGGKPRLNTILSHRRALLYNDCGLPVESHMFVNLILML